MDRTRSIATSEHNELKIFESLLQSTISQAFTALTLFTRSSGRAEEALLQAIQTLDPIEVDSRTFVLRAIEQAVTMPEDKVLVLGEQEEMSLDFPPELQIVFGMPANLRHCFVLRVLLRVSADRCAAILGRQIDEVNESTSAAILFLAGLQQHRIRANREEAWRAIMGGQMTFRT